MTASAPLATHTPTLCGYPLGRARHVCAFVGSRDEEYDVLVPFVREGLERGEKVLQIVDPSKRADHEDRLNRGGVDVAAHVAKEQLTVVGWDEAYLLEGRFDGDRMLKTLESVLADRRARGYPLLRANGSMEWALSGAPGVEGLLDYETRVNLLSEHHPDPLVCVYDLNKFSARTVVDVMRTHPAVIMGGVLRENPYFVPPREMLAEFEARRRARGS